MYQSLAIATGYINQLTFNVPGETGQATPNVLDDIDANDAGTSAKLSFGASNGIVGYSNATISTIGGSDLDSNDKESCNKKVSIEPPYSRFLMAKLVNNERMEGHLIYVHGNDQKP